LQYRSQCICQPVFAKYEAVGGEVAASFFHDGLCLPSGSSLTTAEKQRVVDVICAVHEGKFDVAKTA
jgi:pyridoxal phosphate-dependent aminotransferase EpsN